MGLDCYIDDSRPEWITIGDNVTLSFRVTIAAHGFDTHGVTIGDGVYIGCGAVLLPGITIGEYSVIGAGSVVTKNVPSESLAVGNPAKVIEDVNHVTERRKHYLATHSKMK